MSILARITMANLSVLFRRPPSHNESEVFPPDEPMEYQIPQDWLDNMATWAKVMMTVIAVCLAAGYVGGMAWIAFSPGYLSQ